MSLPEGQTPLDLSGYVPEYRLSTGGTSEVFLGRPLGGGEWVAIKRLLPSLPNDAFGERRLADEALLLSRLAHPGVPTLLGRGESCLILSYFEGCDLSLLMEHLRGEGARPELVAAIGWLAATVLDALHTAYDEDGPLFAVHADITPKNLRIRVGGRLGLIDFGNARHRLASASHDGIVIGTAAYMSPEQVRGEPLDARTDLFSLGVILWELAAGRRLFRRESTSATFDRVLACDVPQLDPALPSALAQSIYACLHPDRADRPTARAVASAMGLLLADDKGGAPLGLDAVAADIVSEACAALPPEVPRLPLHVYRASLEAMALGEDPQLTPDRTDITRVSLAPDLLALMSGLRPAAPRVIAGTCIAASPDIPAPVIAEGDAE